MAPVSVTVPPLTVRPVLRLPDPSTFWMTPAKVALPVRVRTESEVVELLPIVAP